MSENPPPLAYRGRSDSGGQNASTLQTTLFLLGAVAGIAIVFVTGLAWGLMLYGATVTNVKGISLKKIAFGVPAVYLIAGGFLIWANVKLRKSARIRWSLLGLVCGLCAGCLIEGCCYGAYGLSI